jgi:hypothetical protein
VGKVDDDVSYCEPASQVKPASDDAAASDGEALSDNDDIKTFVADDVGCFDSYLKQELILEAAGFHIAQAKVMRGYIQSATECTQQCRENKVPHNDRNYVLVCKYAQNILLPHYDSGTQDKSIMSTPD